MNMTTSLDCMKVTIFTGLALFFLLGIWGRRLREKAFRALSVEQKVQVSDKRGNYTSGEMIPLVGLMLGLLAILLFRPGWLRVPSPFSLRFSCSSLARSISELGTGFEHSASRRRSCRSMNTLES